jgi:hypothetical protein
MKSYVKLFVVALSVAMFAACSSGPSPIMTEAIGISSNVVKMKDSLTTVIDGKISAVKSKIETADSTVDSTTVAGWNSSLTTLSDLQAQLTTWASNIKVLPSAEELAKGTANPFGDMTDDKILEEVKGYVTQIEGLKGQIDAVSAE